MEEEGTKMKGRKRSRKNKWVAKKSGMGKKKCKRQKRGEGNTED